MLFFCSSGYCRSGAESARKIANQRGNQFRAHREERKGIVRFHSQGAGRERGRGQEVRPRQPPAILQEDNYRCIAKETRGGGRCISTGIERWQSRAWLYRGKHGP